jgi:hypothetical protein
MGEVPFFSFRAEEYQRRELVEKCSCCSIKNERTMTEDGVKMPELIGSKVATALSQCRQCMRGLAVHGKCHEKVFPWHFAGQSIELGGVKGGA